MDLWFASSIPSITGYSASKYYFRYFYSVALYSKIFFDALWNSTSFMKDFAVLKTVSIISPCILATNVQRKHWNVFTVCVFQCVTHVLPKGRHYDQYCCKILMIQVLYFKTVVIHNKDCTNCNIQPFGPLKMHFNNWLMLQHSFQNISKLSSNVFPRYKISVATKALDCELDCTCER